MQQNNVKLFTYVEMKYYLSYIYQTYGKNYLRSFKHKKLDE